DAASPAERAFLEEASAATDEHRRRFQWRKEAEWTLLWVIGLVESLGPPARQGDTVALAIDIIPRLGSSVGGFLARATLRSVPELLAEAERHDDLWRRAEAARRSGAVPSDPNWNVLRERRAAFEWLKDSKDWDGAIAAVQ